MSATVVPACAINVVDTRCTNGVARSVTIIPRPAASAPTFGGIIEVVF